MRDAYEIKIKFEDPNALESLERYTLLGSIDRLWQEHLYAIDALRQGINLRTIGQKDPLIEYKREAFTMFSDLMGRIKRRSPRASSAPARASPPSRLSCATCRRS